VKTTSRCGYGAVWRIACAALLALALGTAAAAQPIKIGVIAPAAHIDGRAIMQAAELATQQINANGGIDGRPVKLIKYDDHGSSSDAVRAYQRAVQKDHVVAVTGIFISEVALALEPWTGRLKTPLIDTGAATTEITKRIHDHYASHKYMFQEFTNSNFLARGVCDSGKDIFVKDLGYKTAVVLSENAAWTKPVDAEYKKCLPKIGLKVLDTIVFSPDTNDFSPIFNKIEGLHPDVILTAIAHVGVKPTVQWHQDQVPILLAGISGQAGSSAFWKATNGASAGVITTSTGANGAALTPKTKPFFDAYKKAFNEEPAYDAYTTYDSLYTLKAAIERAGTTQADKLVSALEKTDQEGVEGHIQFYGRHARYTHGLKYGKGLVTGVAFQWQHGQQVVIWPKRIAQGKPVLPDFVKQ